MTICFFLSFPIQSALGGLNVRVFDVQLGQQTLHTGEHLA